MADAIDYVGGGHGTAAPTVVVWRSILLPASETFVRNQILAAQRWAVKAVGLTRVESAVSRPDDVILFAESVLGRLRARAFEITSSSRRVRRYLRASGASVIHAHFGGGGIVIAREARRAGIPLVVTLHGSDVTRSTAGAGVRAERYRWRLRRSLQSAATVIAVSEFIRQKAVEFGSPPDRTVVHHIGIPIDPAPATDAARTGVLLVGRLVEKKGIADLLEAVAVLPEELDVGGVSIVGTGPLEGELKALAATLGLDVRFLGAKTPREVRRMMTACAVYAAPSRVASNGDTEGLPTVVMEAGASGAPTVGYVHSGIPDVVISGETGLLVDEGDVDALSQALSTLLRDPVLAARMGDAARKRVQSHFDIDSQTRQLELIYDDAARSEPLKPGFPPGRQQ